MILDIESIKGDTNCYNGIFIVNIIGPRNRSGAFGIILYINIIGPRNRSGAFGIILYINSKIVELQMRFMV